MNVTRKQERISSSHQLVLFAYADFYCLTRCVFDHKYTISLY
jgi:hypothetical protein